MNIFSDIFNNFKIIGEAFYRFWWAVLPVIFYLSFKSLWMDFVIGRYLSTLEWILLEIIPPREIERSPKIMESLYQGIAGVVASINPFDAYLKGAVMDRFSLEIVGEEGMTHYYIRTQKKFRNLIEAQVYAQYPDSEILEVEDYVKKFPATIPNRDWDLWGSDIELVMPDPYPIKTYDKFMEDVTGKMIDPVAAMAEVIGRLGPGQHIWLQYVLDPQKEDWRKAELKLIDKLAKKAEKKNKSLLGHLVDVFANLPKALFGPVEFGAAEKAADQPVEFKLTPGEKEVLKAVEENFSKNAFKVKMRLIVLGRKEVFDKTFISAFFGAIKQFSDLNLNSFKPNDNSKTYANYIFKKERLAFRQRKIYKRYKERNMDGVKFVLSSKELATVYHFPDMEVKAPSLTRIESKRGSAPPNLPVG